MPRQSQALLWSGKSWLLSNFYLLTQTQEVDSMHDLKTRAKSKNAVRCGATDDPNQRKYGYSHHIHGTMFYCRVSNMHSAEDELLSYKDWPDNVQKTSNAKAIRGYVYVIVQDKKDQ